VPRRAYSDLLRNDERNGLAQGGVVPALSWVVGLWSRVPRVTHPALKMRAGLSERVKAQLAKDTADQQRKMESLQRIEERHAVEAATGGGEGTGSGQGHWEGAGGGRF
jgi:hypothetical protein